MKILAEKKGIPSSRWFKCRRLLMAVVLIGLTRAPGTGQAPSHSDLSADRKILDDWLQASGLSKDFEILKLRSVTPAGEGASAASEMKLELRFLPAGFDEMQEETRFQQFLRGYEAKHLEALPEKLFYKFVQLEGVPRRNASLHFHVLAADYSVFWDPGVRSLVMQRGTDKMVRVPIQVSPSLAAGVGGRLNAPLNTPTESDVRKISSAIQQFLEHYYREANRKSGLPTLLLHADSSEDDSVRMEVAGIKGEILKADNRWEKIGVWVEIKQLDNHWKLVLYLNAWIAAGLGTRPPTGYEEDAERQHRAELELYGRDLLSKIRESLEEHPL